MKKLVSVLMSIITLFTLSIPAIAAEPVVENQEIKKYEAKAPVNVITKYEEGVMVHEISFPTISELMEAKSYATDEENYDSLISAQGKENIQVAKEYINSLDISSKEKAMHIKSLEESVGDGYLDGYKIYTADAATTSDYSYYGTYSNKIFYQRTASEISINYKKETERNLSRLNSWLSTAKDLVLTIEDFAPISMAVTVLDIGQRMVSDNYSARSGDYNEYYVRTVRRLREIGPLNDWGAFHAILVDNKVDMYPYSIYYFGDPAVYGRSAAVTEHMDEWRTVYSEYYNDRSYNLQAAYEQYEARPDIVLYMQGAAVDSSMFLWELK